VTYTFRSPLCTLGFAFIRISSPANNSLFRSKIHHPRRKPIHQSSCIYTLWIHSNYLSPTIKLNSHREAQGQKSDSTSDWWSPGKRWSAIVLWESKSMWEGLIRVARIVFRVINQRDLISCCTMGKKWGWTTRFAVTFFSFPSHSVSTVMLSHWFINALHVM